MLASVILVQPWHCHSITHSTPRALVFIAASSPHDPGPLRGTNTDDLIFLDNVRVAVAIIHSRTTRKIDPLDGRPRRNAASRTPRIECKRACFRATTSCIPHTGYQYKQFGDRIHPSTIEREKKSSPPTNEGIRLHARAAYLTNNRQQHTPVSRRPVRVVHADGPLLAIICV
jgi:hypothetical protein